MDTKARVEPALRDADWKRAPSSQSVWGGTWSVRDSLAVSRSLQALGVEGGGGRSGEWGG